MRISHLFICLAYLSILSFSLKSMEDPEEDLFFRPISRLKFDPSVPRLERDYLLATLNDLNLKKTGKNVISTLNELLVARDTHLIVKLDEHSTSFRGPDLSKEEPPELFINLKNLKNNFVSCIGPMRRFRERSTGVIKEFFEISKCRNPSSVTIGHELLHAINYLNDETSYKVRLRTEQLPLISKRTRIIDYGRRRPSCVAIDSYLWENDEEQMTVWGDPEKPEFSEAQLRLDHTLSPRYPYNGETDFYESADVIIPLLERHLGHRWKVRLNSVFKGCPWKFVQEEAMDSRYNSVNMREYEPID
ncbi:MAG: hypothetical protein K2Q34_00995 [Alphaproteobacteria bacterium]|nr:hypothetical protein [Alphaproteobacteria bacterium]